MWGDAQRWAGWCVPDAERAWRLIQHAGGQITVARLVELSGWSARYLTRVFTAEYGVGPKQAARLARFDHARAELETGGAIADVAADCGKIAVKCTGSQRFGLVNDRLGDSEGFPEI